MDSPKYAEKYADKYAKTKYAGKYVSKIEGLIKTTPWLTIDAHTVDPFEWFFVR